MAKTGAHVHKQIASVARAAAAELYDVVMENNEVFSEWKRQHPGASAKGLLAAFVERNWGRCIPMARATMARLLESPTLDDAVKMEIMEVLELDSTLKKGRTNPTVQLN